MKFFRCLGVMLMGCIGFLGYPDFREVCATTQQYDQEIEVEEVQVHLVANSPVVLLRIGEKAIPIFVDPTVAGSIQAALSGQKFPRPLSHELMFRILGAYEVKVDRVFITLREGIYYGTLTLSQGGQLRLFDSRSSDAIALAIHFHSPILIPKSLLDKVGKPLEVHPTGKGLEL